MGMVIDGGSAHIEADQMGIERTEIVLRARQRVVEPQLHGSAPCDAIRQKPAADVPLSRGQIEMSRGPGRPVFLLKGLPHQRRQHKTAATSPKG
ncbi:hypothetical protein GCM10007301_35640 [Azorhizobium oxalatiphilum]|uniref:Uncharacterized protein n=1 Tax=Azorhizobium oxalatiphilum TaxID=980631 RepID=A0A917C564_9HYPH|nr:hypothetical protein GCM10007301_35640 [Azorhizobium oxalatiphilum]